MLPDRTSPIHVTIAGVSERGEQRQSLAERHRAA
jgi:hypothetical protein